MGPISIQKMAAGITCMADALSLHDPSTIVSINLHSNQIVQIDGLQNFLQLRNLNLSSNCIASISGLSGLVNLESLNLSANRITVISGLHDLHSLKKLLLSYNNISNLAGLGNDFFQQSNPCLHTLELHGNNISDFGQLTFLKHLQSLRVLSLRNDSHSNPICGLPNYATKVRQTLSQVSVLDDGSAIVHTPRIDNALQMVLSRSRKQSEGNLAPWEQTVQEARLDSLETTVDQVLMTVHALANKASSETITTTKNASPNLERTRCKAELSDAATITSIQRNHVGTITVKENMENKNVSVGTDDFIQTKDAKTATDHEKEVVNASVTTDERPKLKNVSVLTEEDQLVLELRTELQSEKTRFLATENGLRAQLASANDFVKESSNQFRETICELNRLKDREIALLKEIESSKSSNEELKIANNASKEREGRMSLQLNNSQQQEIVLRSEIKHSRSMIENLQRVDKMRQQQFNDEIRKLKQQQHEMEIKCQKLSEDRSALKDLTKQAIQKQKQLIREIEAYKKWKDTHQKKHQSCLESHERITSDLKQQLEVATSKVQLFTSKDISMQEELRSAKATVDRQSFHIEELSERLKLMTHENDELRLQNQNLKESSTTRLKILDDQSLQITTLQETIKKLKREKEEWKLVEDSLCQRAEDYRERCHIAEKVAREYEKALESSRAESMELEFALKQMKTEIDQQYQAKNAVEEDLKKMKTSHDEAMEFLSQELAATKSKLQESEAAVVEFTPKLKKADAMVAEALRQRDAAICRARQHEKEMRALLQDVELKKKEAVKFVQSWVS